MHIIIGKKASTEALTRRRYNRGISLVEIIVAVFILTVVLGALITVNNLYIKSSKANINTTKGAYLVSEAIEAIKTIRDPGWNNISVIPTDTDYYLYFDNVASAWIATTTVESLGGFSRKFKLSDVYRDTYGDISTTGTTDPNTKKLQVFVSWNTSSGEVIEKNVTTYITNILED